MVDGARVSVLLITDAVLPMRPLKGGCMKNFRIVHFSVLMVMIAMMQSVPTSAQAITQTFRFTFPVDMTVFIPCANGGLGESVVLTGDIEAVFHVTENRNTFVASRRFRPRGVRGVGLITGDTYNGTGMTRDTFIFRKDTSSTVTIQNIFHIVGQGPGNNFLVFQVLHVNTTPEGEINVTANNMRTECQ